MHKQGFLWDVYSIYKREASISAHERSRHTMAMLVYMLNYRMQMHTESVHKSQVQPQIHKELGEDPALPPPFLWETDFQWTILAQGRSGGKCPRVSSPQMPYKQSRTGTGIVCTEGTAALITGSLPFIKQHVRSGEG